MFNVHTLNNIKDRKGGSYKKPGHRLGSAYEQELKKKLRSIIKFNSEINDLSEKLLLKLDSNLFLNKSLILRVNVSLKPNIPLKSNHLNQILKTKERGKFGPKSFIC